MLCDFQAFKLKRGEVIDPKQWSLLIQMNNASRGMVRGKQEVPPALWKVLKKQEKAVDKKANS